MLALEIQDFKSFLSKLFHQEIFDNFLLSEAAITSRVHYTIDGTLNLAQFPPQDQTLFSQKGINKIPFSYVKKTLFDMMRGNEPPVYLKLIFLLSPENQNKTIASCDCSSDPDQISGMFLNLTYQQDKLLCTTGVAYTTFLKDRELEKSWDQMIKHFFTRHEINFLEL